MPTRSITQPENDARPATAVIVTPPLHPSVPPDGFTAIPRVIATELPLARFPQASSTRTRGWTPNGDPPSPAAGASVNVTRDAAPATMPKTELVVGARPEAAARSW